jgi:hypothetical protein
MLYCHWQSTSKESTFKCRYALGAKTQGRLVPNMFRDLVPVKTEQTSPSYSLEITTNLLEAYKLSVLMSKFQM